MIVRPSDERILQEEFYLCTFCREKVTRGAVWMGPNISVCGSCLTSDRAADLMGRILGDVLFAVYGGKAYKTEVEAITKQVEASIYRVLYNHARVLR